MGISVILAHQFNSIVMLAPCGCIGVGRDRLCTALTYGLRFLSPQQCCVPDLNLHDAQEQMFVGELQVGPDVATLAHCAWLSPQCAAAFVAGGGPSIVLRHVRPLSHEAATQEPVMCAALWRVHVLSGAALGPRRSFLWVSGQAPRRVSG